jgi:hypothetical protein
MPVPSYHLAIWWNWSYVALRWPVAEAFFESMGGGSGFVAARLGNMEQHGVELTLALFRVEVR